jgi:hypothetical protein
MALIAGSPKLSLVNVRMAIGTSLTHIGKHRLGVTLSARYALVHSAKRKTCLVVIKFRYAADGFPPAHRMTILTGNTERPVRAASISGRLRLRGHDARSQQDS